MRPAASNSTSATGDAVLRQWNSPMPYLFGGLAFMLLLISAALFILACSYRKSSSENTRNRNIDHHREAAAAKQEAGETKMDVKIVVIMPGDDNPTYLAKPVSADLRDQV
ncbi:protein GLUTAMINE DUMPER 1-like [Carica papaya]|uniref:protein GLUTAMINE DUMPER 1-like n=1 Tax=Carica papaya TaxID=3649 RepID=UPI000B8C9919|nr:protein GLUTAMINE DUMPER 1-like [Carica papaya]